MNKREQAIETIRYWRCSWELCEDWCAGCSYFKNSKCVDPRNKQLLEELESLGYVQPKPSGNLEQSITELAKMIQIHMPKGYEMENIEGVIRAFLSANHLVQLKCQRCGAEICDLCFDCQEETINEAFAEATRKRSAGVKGIIMSQHTSEGKKPPIRFPSPNPY